MAGNRMQGPWVKKLIVRFMARQAIPNGGGFADGVEFLLNKGAIVAAAKNATVLAFLAIDLVRAAPDCGWDTDEDVAQRIMESIAEKHIGRDKKEGV